MALGRDGAPVPDVTPFASIRRAARIEGPGMRERGARAGRPAARAAPARADGPAGAMTLRSGGAPSANPVDHALLASARGDAQAFATLYDLCSPSVYGLIRRILRDRAQSDEVMQEVMLEVWRLAPRFDPQRGSASAWIMTIAHRRAVDRVRAEVAERGRLERAGSQAPTAGVSVQEDVVDDLDRQRVRSALAGLTDLQRSSLELAYFGGLTQTEIAALLDVPLGTVKTRIRDGLIRLRDALGEGS
jgi:RNA polymerase sigma-70 factor (ECF subfamily)